MTSTGALSLGEFLCLLGILVNFADRDSFSWKHSKHLVHRMSLVGLMSGWSPESENSDLKFRLSLRKRETFKTHVKEASQLDSSFCSTLVSLPMFLQPIAVGSSLGTNIWVSACGHRNLKRKRKTFLMVPYLFGIFASRLDEVGELSRSAAVKERRALEKPILRVPFHWVIHASGLAGGSLYSDS